MPPGHHGLLSCKGRVFLLEHDSDPASRDPFERSERPAPVEPRAFCGHPSPMQVCRQPQEILSAPGLQSLVAGSPLSVSPHSFK